MDQDEGQRVVFGTLLEAHPALVSIEAFGDVPNAAEAVEHLVRDGVASRLGGKVGLTRAAVRTDQLTL